MITALSYNNPWKETDHRHIHLSLSVFCLYLFTDLPLYNDDKARIYKPSSPLIFSFVVSSEVEMINSPNIELSKQTVRNYFRFHNISNIKY